MLLDNNHARLARAQRYAHLGSKRGIVVAINVKGRRVGACHSVSAALPAQRCCPRRPWYCVTLKQEIRVKPASSLSAKIVLEPRENNDDAKAIVHSSGCEPHHALGFSALHSADHHTFE